MALKSGYLSHQLPAQGYYNPGGLLATWLNMGFDRAGQSTWVNIIGLLLLVGSGIYANFILISRRMNAQRHLLVATSMLMFTSLFPGSNVMLPALIVLPLFIALFSNITQLYQSDHPRTHIINAGILAGAGYLLYHPFVFILPACFVGLAFMRPFRLAEWALLLMGMITPAYFLLSIEFLSNHWQPEAHLPHFIFVPAALKGNAYWWMATATASVWIIAGFAAWQAQTRRMVIQGRKNWYTLLLMGLFMVPGIFIPNGNAYGMLALLSFPAGSLAAYAFVGDSRNVGKMLFFWLIIILIAIVGWGWRTGAL
ncbi:MAG TPA: hypothetical protein VLC98_17180 [Phnomibacter sp.]|nr:hypothetical protein [Phnomibacter sp.]